MPVQVFLAEHLRYDLPRLRHLLEDARKGMTTQGARTTQVGGGNYLVPPSWYTCGARPVRVQLVMDS